MGMAHLNSDDALLKRVRRIAGQVAAIERALAGSDNCTTTLHLVAATRGAINGLMDKIIEAHVREHVAGPDLRDDERAAGAEELIAAIRRYSK
jgi:DNA-binding FrmR family transcriptional regulator